MFSPPGKIYPVPSYWLHLHFACLWSWPEFPALSLGWCDGSLWLRRGSTLLSHVGILSCCCTHQLYAFPTQTGHFGIIDATVFRYIHFFFSSRSYPVEVDVVHQSFDPNWVDDLPPSPLALVSVYCGIAWLGFLLFHDIVLMTYGPSLFTSQPLLLWKWGGPVFPWTAEFTDYVYLCLCESLWQVVLVCVLVGSMYVCLSCTCAWECEAQCTSQG